MNWRNVKQVLGKLRFPERTCMIPPPYSVKHHAAAEVLMFLCQNILLVQVAGVMLNSSYGVGASDMIWSVLMTCLVAQSSLICL
jgi:hypothetical protein